LAGVVEVLDDAGLHTSPTSIAIIEGILKLADIEATFAFATDAFYQAADQPLLSPDEAVVAYLLTDLTFAHNGIIMELPEDEARSLVERRTRGRLTKEELSARLRRSVRQFPW
jgi:hypothetical protein